MSAASIADFLGSPYALVVDVRMLNFFRYLDGTAGIVVLALLVGSMFVQNLWCRYLCPYGAFLGLTSLLSPTRITRSSEACIDCAKCAKACPSALPVDKLVQIRSAGGMHWLSGMRSSLPGERRPRNDGGHRLAQASRPTGLGLGGWYRNTILRNDWLRQAVRTLTSTNIPKQVYLQLVPAADEQQHPMPSGQ